MGITSRRPVFDGGEAPPTTYLRRQSSCLRLSKIHSFCKLGNPLTPIDCVRLVWQKKRTILPIRLSGLSLLKNRTSAPAGGRRGETTSSRPQFLDSVILARLKFPSNYCI
jgi:hypothetical protein